MLSPAPMHAQTPARDSIRGVLYATAGAELTQYDVDAENASLVRKNSIRLPANVQYAWPHPSRKYFYVAWSDGGASSAAPGAATVPRGKLHGVSAFRVDPRSGALQPIGQPVSLAARPIHLSVDILGTHVLIAYNDPSGVTVHRLNADGTIGALVNQPAPLDTGIYAHQVRVEASNKTAFLVTRGNGPTKDKPEDRGAVKVFSYSDGKLKNRASIAPDGGVNFQPRHLDFHPSRPWVFVSLERQSKLQVYQMTKDGSLGAVPLFAKDSLADPAHRTAVAGTVHVHPSGRFVYQANRSAISDQKGRPVDGGGEKQHRSLRDQSADRRAHVDSKRRHARCGASNVCPRSERPDSSGRKSDCDIRGIGRERENDTGQFSRIPHTQRREAGFRAQVRRRYQRGQPVLDGYRPAAVDFVWRFLNR